MSHFLRFSDPSSLYVSELVGTRLRMDSALRIRKGDDLALATQPKQENPTVQDDHGYQDWFQPLKDGDPAAPSIIWKVLSSPLQEGEEKWREVDHILLQNGYLLRPRYDPNCRLKLDERSWVAWGISSQ
jgi:hypothetical protein